jgi:hypothetical protein
MIDTSKNIIHKFINEKRCKTFLKTPYHGISDKQISSVFMNYLKHKKEKENFFFTKKTVERILKMDISKVEPSSLSFLGEKHNKEFSFCFLEKENISFCFTIDINSIKVVVFNGDNNSAKATINESIGKTTLNYSGFNKSIVGSAIINFSLNELVIIPANALYHVKNKNIPSDYLKDLKKASKNESYLTALNEDFKTKSDVIFLAIKTLVFLKTASVIDKTFVSENKNLKFKIKSKYGINEQNNKVTVINSFYDESINVLNPFSVSGHFRNQPKKNGVEIIYIDSFMKKGYYRPAKILSQS